jgi:cytochrome c biogenesis factor
VPAQGRSFADGVPVTALCLAVLAFVLLITRSRVIRGSIAAAVLLGGAVVAMDSVRRVENAATLAVGQTVDVGPVQVRLAALEPVAGPGHTAVRAHLVVLRDGEAVSSIYPEHRTGIYPRTNSSPRAVALIKANGLSVRVVGTDTKSAALTLVWHPLLS